MKEFEWCLWVIIAAVIIELINFSLKYLVLKSNLPPRAHLEWKGKRLGVHHGFVGLALILLYIISRSSFWFQYAILGIGLILTATDLIHHCLYKLKFGKWD